MAFLLLGLGLATAVIFLFDSVWKKRFHAVRRPLVDDEVREIHRGPDGSSVDPKVVAHGGFGGFRGDASGEIRQEVKAS
jgi:hypothetical protein